MFPCHLQRGSPGAQTWALASMWPHQPPLPAGKHGVQKLDKVLPPQVRATIARKCQLGINCRPFLLGPCGHRTSAKPEPTMVLIRPMSKWVVLALNLEGLATVMVHPAHQGQCHLRAHRAGGITVTSEDHLIPFVGRPNAWRAALHAEHVHSSLRGAEESAEAQEGTDSHSRCSSPVLGQRDTGSFTHGPVCPCAGKDKVLSGSLETS